MNRLMKFTCQGLKLKIITYYLMFLSHLMAALVKSYKIQIVNNGTPILHRKINSMGVTTVFASKLAF